MNPGLAITAGLPRTCPWPEDRRTREQEDEREDEDDDDETRTSVDGDLGGALAALLGGCFEDTGSTDSDGGGETGCIECGSNQAGPFACECKVGGNWSPEGDDRCTSPQNNPADVCKVVCESAYGVNTEFKSADPCEPASGYNCTNWNPASQVTLLAGVYRVNATWFASFVANIAPLYACDDGEFHPNSTYARFVLSNVDSDDFLYAIGLRNGRHDPNDQRNHDQRVLGGVHRIRVVSQRYDRVLGGDQARCVQHHAVDQSGVENHETLWLTALARSASARLGLWPRHVGAT
jgi:hypothetical protein